MARNAVRRLARGRSVTSANFEVLRTIGKRRGGGTIADHGSDVVESYDGKRRMRLTRCFW
jgi:hypothetical protein